MPYVLHMAKCFFCFFLKKNRFVSCAFSFHHPSVSLNLRHFSFSWIGLSVLTSAKWVNNTVQLLNAHSVSARFNSYNQCVFTYRLVHFKEMSWREKLPEAIFHNIDSSSYWKNTQKESRIMLLCYGGFIAQAISDSRLAAFTSKKINSRGVSTPKQHSAPGRKRHTLTAIQTGLEMVSKQHFS